jgi:hypothetical protein
MSKTPDKVQCDKCKDKFGSMKLFLEHPCAKKGLHPHAIKIPSQR